MPSLKELVKRELQEWQGSTLSPYIEQEVSNQIRLKGQLYIW